MREAMRSTGRALAFGVLVSVAGCKDPRNQPIPPDLKSIAEDKSVQASLEKLSPDERALVGGYMVRAVLAKTFTGEPGKARTLGEAIEEQKKFVAERAAKEAQEKALAERVATERAAAMKAMDDVLTVALTDKTVYPKDFSAGRYSEQIGITVAYQNKGTKDLLGVKGRLICNDIFGDEITSFEVKVDEPIAGGKTYVWHGVKDLNQFRPADTKFANTTMDKIKASWEPGTYLFASSAESVGEPIGLG